MAHLCAGDGYRDSITPRIVNAVLHMGAYEFPAEIEYLYLPVVAR